MKTKNTKAAKKPGKASNKQVGDAKDSKSGAGKSKQTKLGLKPNTEKEAEKSTPATTDETPIHSQEVDEVDEDFKNKNGVINRDHCNVCKDGGDLLMCDHCPRSFHTDCLKVEASTLDLEDDWYCPRCKPVVEKRRRIETEKAERKLKREQERLERHQEKERTKQEKVEKREEELKQKGQLLKLQRDFMKEHSQFAENGFIKYPIEDGLLTKNEKLHGKQQALPVPQVHTFISHEVMKKLVPLWDFIVSFDSLLSMENLPSLEELYCALEMSSSVEEIGLLYHLHKGIMKVIFKEIQEMKYIDEAEENLPLTFLRICPDIVEYAEQNWVEGLKIFLQSEGMQVSELMGDAELKELMTKLEDLDNLGYQAKLSLKTKLSVLDFLVSHIKGSERLKEALVERIKMRQEISRERNELVSSLKPEEAAMSEINFEYKNISAKLEELETKYEEADESVSRQQVQKLQGELKIWRGKFAASSKKKTEREKNILKIKTKLTKINTELLEYPIRTEIVGRDRYHNEYFVFPGEKNRLYVRTQFNLESSHLVKDMEKHMLQPQRLALSEHWYFYSSRAEIEALMESLNRRGIREKALKDKLKTLMDNSDFLVMDQQESLYYSKPVRLHSKVYSVRHRVRLESQLSQMSQMSQVSENGNNEGKKEEDHHEKNMEKVIEESMDIDAENHKEGITTTSTSEEEKPTTAPSLSKEEKLHQLVTQCQSQALNYNKQSEGRSRITRKKTQSESATVNLTVETLANDLLEIEEEFSRDQALLGREWDVKKERESWRKGLEGAQSLEEVKEAMLCANERFKAPYKIEGVEHNEDEFDESEEKHENMDTDENQDTPVKQRKSATANIWNFEISEEEWTGYLKNRIEGPLTLKLAIEIWDTCIQEYYQRKSYFMKGLIKRREEKEQEEHSPREVKTRPSSTTAKTVMTRSERKAATRNAVRRAFRSERTNSAIEYSEEEEEENGNGYYDEDEDEDMVSDESDDDENEDSCTMCDKGGNLLCCDNCPKSYHLKCLGMDDLPGESKWVCPSCEEHLQKRRHTRSITKKLH